MEQLDIDQCIAICGAVGGFESEIMRKGKA